MDERLRDIIANSDNIVFFGGAGVSTESNIPDFRSESGLYNAQQKYGRSPEEMLSHSFFMRHTDTFFDYYKNNLIYRSAEPNKAHRALAKLEEQGKLKSIITRDIFSLPRRAGCQNVYELHGSVYRNFCPHCGRQYPVEYIQHSRGVPRCESCGSVIRPGVSLVGEMVDNALISRAAEEVRKADTLLVIGCNLKASLTNTFLRYFEGDELVLINKDEHFADNIADLVIHGNPMDILKDLGI